MSDGISYVAVVTILIIMQYMFFTARAGAARGRDTVVAPAMTGDQGFERRVRVQLNTLEQMAVTIPAMWLCTYFFRADVAAVLGLVYIVARFAYSAGYISSPEKRVPGMIATMLSNVVLLLCALFGIIRGLL